MRIYILTGSSLSHSFSKKYFTEKFYNENLLDCSYDNFELNNIRELKSILISNPDIAGVNVTIPFKCSVMELLDEVDDKAASIGAVNTIKIVRKNGAIWLKGFNTDHIGFEQSIEKELKPYHKRALILGTGGSSDAVAYVLRKKEIEFVRVSRRKSEEVMQYGDLTAEILGKFQVIVNCTPSGMFPEVETFPVIPYEYLTPKHLLFDLIYNPEETLFMKKGKAFKAVVLNGYNMLCIQAEASWRIWNTPV